MNHNNIPVYIMDHYFWFGPPKVGPKYKTRRARRRIANIFQKRVIRYRHATQPIEFRDGTFGAAYETGITVFSSRSINRNRNGNV